MPTIEMASALLESMTHTDVQALPLHARRRLAAACRRAAELATRADAPKAGVLAALWVGRQS
jgi:hypothetical protein